MTASTSTDEAVLITSLGGAFEDWLNIGRPDGEVKPPALVHEGLARLTVAFPPRHAVPTRRATANRRAICNAVQVRPQNRRTLSRFAASLVTRRWSLFRGPAQIEACTAAD